MTNSFTCWERLFSFLSAYLDFGLPEAALKPVEIYSHALSVICVVSPVRAVVEREHFIICFGEISLTVFV